MLAYPFTSARCTVIIRNMEIAGVYFRNHLCFRDDWVGFDDIKPINVIIGCNNTGKSRILDLVQASCGNKPIRKSWPVKFTSILRDEEFGNLKQHYRLNDGSELGWSYPPESNQFNRIYLNGQEYDKSDGTFQRLNQWFSSQMDSAQLCLRNHIFSHLLAERDIVPENKHDGNQIDPSGNGSTNLIRRFLYSSEKEYPREVITGELLDGLNQIFANDGCFNEIYAQDHDHGSNRSPYWEIYLGEEKKGLIPLSKSGSGLKTVILVLLKLLVVPIVEGKSKCDYVFAFEELENNLHPSLLRRLFQYIESYAYKEKAHFFLTTHSSTALDFFGLSKDAQIIHVKHNGHFARSQTVSAHFDRVQIVSELGVKPSDLLQANGIIWVEGPSDRIYINKWISLLSNGEIQEGKDYQCAFYGGSLLAKTEFKSREEESRHRDKVNLLRVNSNIYLVCDGDRATQKSKIKDRVRRIKQEVDSIPGANIWITKGREIENYVPGVIMEAVFNLKKVADPDKYDSFFPRKKSPGKSFIESNLNRKSLDKNEFAIECSNYMSVANMKDRFDWYFEMQKILSAIRDWNK